MKALAWNMQGKHENWAELARFGADVSLVSEATLTPEGISAIGRGKTLGRDFERNFSTAVASAHPLSEITDARAARRGKPIDIPFADSRPGTWTAAVVSIPGGDAITAISLYGLLEEKSDASVHRSLSEFTPLFEDPRYRELLLLGGDLNILANPALNDPRATATSRS